MALYSMFSQRYGNDAVAITPSDTQPITDAAGNAVQPILYIGGAGNVAVKTALGTSITFTAVPAGTVIPVMVSQVMATGTTATGIVGIFVK